MIEAEIKKKLADAMRCYGSGRLKEAASLCFGIIDADKQNSKAWHLLGTIARQKKRYDDAVSLIKNAISISPEIAVYHYDLGLVLEAQGKPEMAETALKKSILLNPNQANAYNVLGNILGSLGRDQEAIENYEHSLFLEPDSATVWFRLGNAFKKQGLFPKAIESYRHAVKHNKNYFQAYNNLGNTLRELGKYNEAVENFDKTLKLNPGYAEAHFNRSLIILAKGDFLLGWKGYEQRLNVPEYRSCFPNVEGIPCWDGSPFVGKKLFVWDEQGFGDTLQFIRYLPATKARGGEVIFGVDKALMELLRHSPGIDRLVERPANEPGEIEGDLHVPLLSLPEIFGTSLDSIPGKIPYLFASTSKSCYWRTRIRGDCLQIGLVWSGNPMHPNDRNRSCQLVKFVPLAHLSHVRLFGLQKGEASKQVNNLPTDIKVINLDEEIHDFSDTAAIINNLDLIISVDTSVAHLAGAMGKPVWVLVPKRLPDWRWLMEREDSPWYPTMVLFRQSRSGDWDSVIMRMVKELSDPVGNLFP